MIILISFYFSYFALHLALITNTGWNCCNNFDHSVFAPALLDESFIASKSIIFNPSRNSALKMVCPDIVPPLIYDCPEQCFPVLFGHRTPCHLKHLCRTLNKVLMYEAKKKVNLRKVMIINKYYTMILGWHIISLNNFCIWHWLICLNISELLQFLNKQVYFKNEFWFCYDITC